MVKASSKRGRSTAEEQVIKIEVPTTMEKRQVGVVTGRQGPERKIAGPAVAHPVEE